MVEGERGDGESQDLKKREESVTRRGWVSASGGAHVHAQRAKCSDTCQR